METILSISLSFLFMCFAIAAFTWFWWMISRRFFIFLFYFSEDALKLKNDSWKKIVFNYGIFGPLGLASISGYIYTLIIFFKIWIN